VLLWDGRRAVLVRRGAGGLFPHTWTLPGGELLPGESAELGGMRIVEKQLGISTSHVRQVRELPQPSHFRDARGPDTVVQAVTWSGDPAAGLAKAAWFDLQALDEIRIFREARDLLRDICGGLAMTEPIVPATP